MRRQISNCSVAVLIALSPNWHEIIRVREIDMANNSSQSNGDMPFSVDINDYGDADVVAFGTTTHKLSKLKEALKLVMNNAISSCLYSEFNSKLNVATGNWVNPGADCEILKVGGKGWKKGKIKFEITVKFYPDEPDVEEVLTSNEQKVNQAELPLDDIRLMVNKLS